MSVKKCNPNTKLIALILKLVKFTLISFNYKVNVEESVVSISQFQTIHEFKFLDCINLFGSTNFIFQIMLSLEKYFVLSLI